MDSTGWLTSRARSHVSDPSGGRWWEAVVLCRRLPPDQNSSLQSSTPQVIERLSLSLAFVELVAYNTGGRLWRQPA